MVELPEVWGFLGSKLFLCLLAMSIPFAGNRSNMSVVVAALVLSLQQMCVITIGTYYFDRCEMTRQMEFTRDPDG